MKNKKVLIPIVSLIGICVVLSASFAFYVGSYNHADSYAKEYLKSDDKVEVSKGDGGIIFKPKSEIKAGFIFYPGGKVEYSSYAPFMHMLAEQGIYSVIEKMTFNLAFFSINQANKTLKNHDDIEFYLGGHSLGGVAASKHIKEHPSTYKGFVLLASYSTYNMSSYSYKTLSLLGENDKVLNKSSYDKNIKNLPNVTEVTIQGGIHSYFGSYGIQKGDGTPSITCEEQQTLIANYISSFILN